MIDLIKKHRFIIAILLIAFVIRFVNLDQLPALNADEAALGYNAYSLIQTGLDEHGNPWPLHFQSFNDYKPALYGYIIMPFIALFGLSEWTVRIPGAMFGVLNVYFIWLLLRQFDYKRIKILGLTIGLEDIGALFLAFSPWHIHFSRGGWEVNAATCFITAGLYFAIKGFKNHVSNFIYACMFFVASLYTYHAARLIVPLLLVGLAAIYFKDFLKLENKKIFFGTILLGAILLLPLTYDFLGPAGAARASGVSIFSDRGSIDRINEKRGQHGASTSAVSKLFHNRPFEYSLAFAENYLEHFDGDFLFLSGDDIQRNKIPDMGLLYLFEFPLLIIAFYYLANKSNKLKPIIWWLIISPIAAAITFQSPHALRAQNMIIPLAIFSALGFYLLLDWLSYLNSKLIKKFSITLITLILVWSYSRYLHQYHTHMAKTYPFSSQYGVKELVEFIDAKQGEYEKIYITDRYDQPYVLFLFYLKYPPENFQANHVLTDRGEFGFSTVTSFDKYEFVDVNWDEMRDYQNALIVGTDEDVPEVGANVVKKIYFPNGEIAFEIIAK